MDANEHKSRSSLNKFGIDSISQIVERELKNRYVEDKRLFFEFFHFDNGNLKCRLAYKDDNGVDYECYLEFKFEKNPYEVVVSKRYLWRSRREGVRLVEHLWGLEPLDFDTLVDQLTKAEDYKSFKAKIITNTIEKVAEIFNR